jgi:FtsP/CotA-like multicopper oxidase with cupredoxin domain
VVNGLSRRRLLQTGAALGVAGTIPLSATRAAGESSISLDKYVQPLPIPEVREPDGKQEGSDAYQIPVTEFTQNLHPDLPETTLWGFDGVYPGPIIETQRNQPVSVRFDNSHLPEDHLLNVDYRIHGTTPENYPGYDGPVPEVRTVTHFHGLKIKPENDGQSGMWTSPDGVTGPGFANQWQELPMRQSRLTSTYHDHTLGITRLNGYAGLIGLYYIRSQTEKDLNLPSDKYDIPLLVQDKSFNSDGSLAYPDSWTPMFAGDTAVVNGSVWPSLEVEPRRYRFRIVNGANHRTFSLQLTNESSQGVPTLYQFAPDQGFLASIVPIGSAGSLNSLVLQSFERGEVIVDFSDHAGETFTLTNNAELPYTGANSGSDLSELMQIRVTDPSVKPVDESVDPTDLNLPSPPEFDRNAVREIREMDLGVAVQDGLVTYQLNGHGFGDQEAIVRPRLGSTEIWELQNNTSGSHPIHLHLVTFRVIGRGPDGTDPPDPNERGHKDTVRVEPGETVRVITRFEGYTGQFPWHCHMLEHEDNKMMLKFEVVPGDDGDGGDDDSEDGDSEDDERRRGPPDHAGERGPPDHAGEKGPPDHANGRGPPDHAGEKGPPDHANGRRS